MVNTEFGEEIMIISLICMATGENYSSMVSKFGGNWYSYTYLTHFLWITCFGNIIMLCQVTPCIIGLVILVCSKNQYGDKWCMTIMVVCVWA